LEDCESVKIIKKNKFFYILVLTISYFVLKYGIDLISRQVHIITDGGLAAYIFGSFLSIDFVLWQVNS